MPNSTFDEVAQTLEERSTLNRLEARGTLRIALKNAGLEAARATADQIEVVIRKCMPVELASRGVEDADGLCSALIERVRSLRLDMPASDETPEDVFGRFGA